MKINRRWAMPNSETFQVKPIGEFVRKYLNDAVNSVDPFARNCDWANETNDLNPNTSAEYHMDAEKFLLELAGRGFRADLVLFDPPYSPRQIVECYKASGLEITQKTTQNSAMLKVCKDALVEILTHGGIVLSFGWNSVGMGKKRGFEIIEILLVCHGGAHNDTICMAEKLTEGRLFNG